ncbi:hypothetical protein ADUPG1_009296, partial [Aduncisulcus paluster]
WDLFSGEKGSGKGGVHGGLILLGEKEENELKEREAKEEENQKKLDEFRRKREESSERETLSGDVVISAGFFDKMERIEDNQLFDLCGHAGIWLGGRKYSALQSHLQYIMFSSASPSASLDLEKLGKHSFSALVNMSPFTSTSAATTIHSHSAISPSIESPLIYFLGLNASLRSDLLSGLTNTNFLPNQHRDRFVALRIRERPASEIGVGSGVGGEWRRLSVSALRSKDDLSRGQREVMEFENGGRANTPRHCQISAIFSDDVSTVDALEVIDRLSTSLNGAMHFKQSKADESFANLLSNIASEKKRLLDQALREWQSEREKRDARTPRKQPLSFSLTATIANMRELMNGMLDLDDDGEILELIAAEDVPTYFEFEGKGFDGTGSREEAQKSEDAVKEYHSHMFKEFSELSGEIFTDKEQDLFVNMLWRKSIEKEMIEREEIFEEMRKERVKSYQLGEEGSPSTKVQYGRKRKPFEFTSTVKRAMLEAEFQTASAALPRVLPPIHEGRPAMAIDADADDVIGEVLRAHREQAIGMKGSDIPTDQKEPKDWVDHAASLKLKDLSHTVADGARPRPERSPAVNKTPIASTIQNLERIRSDIISQEVATDVGSTISPRSLPPLLSDSVSQALVSSPVPSPIPVSVAGGNRLQQDLKIKKGARRVDTVRTLPAEDVVTLSQSLNTGVTYGSVSSQAMTQQSSVGLSRMSSGLPSSSSPLKKSDISRMQQELVAHTASIIGKPVAQLNVTRIETEGISLATRKSMGSARRRNAKQNLGGASAGPSSLAMDSSAIPHHLHSFDPSPSSVQYGYLSVGKSYATTLVLRNTGVKAWRFRISDCSSTPNAEITCRYSRGSVAAGMTRRVVVYIHCLNPGAVFGTLNVLSETEMMSIPVNAQIVTGPVKGGEEREEEEEMGISDGLWMGKDVKEAMFPIMGSETTRSTGGSAFGRLSVLSDGTILSPLHTGRSE